MDKFKELVKGLTQVSASFREGYVPVKIDYPTDYIDRQLMTVLAKALVKENIGKTSFHTVNKDVIHDIRLFVISEDELLKILKESNE